MITGMRTAIRKYTSLDCEAVIDVWFAASLLATPFLSKNFLENEREMLRTVWLKEADTWVYEEDGQVAGFLSLIGNEVGGIFVHPDVQGRGVGTTLMDHARSLCDELHLDVFEENAIGRRFYERYGFEVEYTHVHEPSGHMQMRLHLKP